MTDKTQETPGALQSRPVGRRDLLKLGATTAVLPAVIGPAALSTRRERNVAVAEESPGDVASGPFTVGYWNGDPDSSMVAANRLSAGDRELARSGAVVQMIAMGGDSAVGLQSMTLDVQIGAGNFHAWRYENNGIQNVSSPSAFSVPVDRKAGLRFALTARHQGTNGSPKTSGFRLSTGKESTLPKLQPGFYVIAIGERNRRLQVNWHAYEIAGDNTGQSFVLRKNGKPATDFAYLIFTVEPKQVDVARFV